MTTFNTRLLQHTNLFPPLPCPDDAQEDIHAGYPLHVVGVRIAEFLNEAFIFLPTANIDNYCAGYPKYREQPVWVPQQSSQKNRVYPACILRVPDKGVYACVNQLGGMNIRFPSGDTTTPWKHNEWGYDKYHTKSPDYPANDE